MGINGNKLGILFAHMHANIPNTNYKNDIFDGNNPETEALLL